jgi:hypothetical protein
MTRTRVGLAVVTALIGAAGALGLAACGPAVDATALTPEGQALAAIGFDGADLSVGAREEPQADPSASASRDRAGDGPRRRGLRHGMLRKNTLHGEVVVQTKDGTKTIDVQRGTVTAIDDKTVTVKSADGFTLTWTLGTPLHVVEHRTTVQASAVKVGTEIGVAGTKDGGTTTAHVIIIPNASK